MCGDNADNVLTLKSTELCSDEILFDYIHPDKIDIGEAHKFAVAIADGKSYCSMLILKAG